MTLYATLMRMYPKEQTGPMIVLLNTSAEEGSCSAALVIIASTLAEVNVEGRCRPIRNGLQTLTPRGPWTLCECVENHVQEQNGRHATN